MLAERRQVRRRRGRRAEEAVVEVPVPQKLSVAPRDHLPRHVHDRAQHFQSSHAGRHRAPPLGLQRADPHPR